MSASGSKKTASKKGRPRRGDLVTAEANASAAPSPDPSPAPVAPKPRKKTGTNSQGKRRPITEGEPDPWAHDETTLSMPRSLSNDSAQLLLGDCHEIVRELPDASVNLIYCDPPFG